MRRNLLLTLAFAASTVALAQDNLAIGGAATSTKGDAGFAIDGNNGTRWEFPAGEIKEETDATWDLDLGEVKAFNTIQIKWEGAYSKSFTISVSENGTDYTDVVTKVDETINVADDQTYSFDEVNARYIKFVNNARATQWGVSFYEFRVLKMDAATLTSISLSAANNVVKVGTGVALTAQGKDQIGGKMDAGDVTYEVLPEGMGTVTDGVYTPAQAGEAKIVAKSGEITSNEITVTAYSGDKINIFENWAAMVTTIGEGSKAESMAGAFDDNMNSLWELYGGNNNLEYETGFIIDLQALYDITAISATFEGACPADYTVSFAGNDREFTEAHAVTDHPGMATFTDFFLAEGKGVRYVKFFSTKAATPYGVKLYDFSVYGENKQEIPDNNAPTEFTATVNDEAATISYVVLNLKATDDVSNIVYEISYNKESAEPYTVTKSGESGKEVVYNLGVLEAGTEYTISVVAKDANGNATDPIVLTASTKPMPGAAPEPKADKANVMSVYSDKYGNAAGFTLPNWEELTATTLLEIVPGDQVMLLSQFTYRGLEFTKMDVSDMEYLHVDVFPEVSTFVTIVPIWRNVADNGNAAEIAYTIDGLKPNEWNSIDIPMSAFASDDRAGTNNVYQIKLDGGNKTIFLFDNIYFHKSGVADTEAPVLESAEATVVADKTATITVKATDNNEAGMLTYTVKNGDEELATKKAQAGVETTIDLKGLTPETAYTLTVTVKDAAGNEGESKNVEFTTTAKVEQPMSGEGEIIVLNDVITTPKTLKYTWNISQNKTTVTLTVKVTDDTDVDGLVKGNANIDTWTNETANAEANDVLTYTWENLAEGDVLKAKIWWAVAGGRAESDEITYTIEDTELVTTAIEGVTVAVPAANDAIYNLAGQRVSKATKGVYIINGKKVIVK